MRCAPIGGPAEDALVAVAETEQAVRQQAALALQDQEGDARDHCHHQSCHRRVLLTSNHQPKTQTKLIISSSSTC